MRNKVLFFADNLIFGGVEQSVIQLMEGLDSNLWEPVLVHHPSNGLQPLIEKVENLKIRRIETPQMPLGIKGMRGMIPLLKILSQEKPDIFHAYLSWPLACKWGVVAAILTRVPAIVITHGLYLDVPYSRMSRLQQRIISTRVGKYITVSSAIAEQLMDVFQIAKQKIRVIHNAVESVNFEHAAIPCELAELNEATPKHLILTVARLDKQKGHSDLLKAAVEITDAIFVLLGDGPERSALEEQSRQLGLDGRIIFAGFRSDVSSWLSACDVFVLPSLFEGLPIAILEAMAAEKPVIATAIPGNAEAVVQGVTGYLVPPQNPRLLAAAIRSMLADPALRNQMGQAGKEIVMQKFSAKAMIGQITQVYSECLGGRHQTSS